MKGSMLNIGTFSPGFATYFSEWSLCKYHKNTKNLKICQKTLKIFANLAKRAETWCQPLYVLNRNALNILD